LSIRLFCFDSLLFVVVSLALFFLSKGLTTAFNREAVDQIAEKFCYLNSKVDEEKR